MRKATDQEVQNIAHHLQGTCSGIEYGASAETEDELDIDDLEERLGWHIEICRGCGWWHELWELTDPDDENNDGLCDDCRESE